ncbi:PREDICTED: uncharacterized protein LOC104825103 [Tarenaya hassleriana]|uniref:uncharacterized protein LOC104825103 n=1 Tax=Tarenaya hassleriana TaxID=28532 RepID=UPI00053C4A9E|nr:PREDICTED: uncharacterized protein LOC104825103 [Tarenaya hassleriana]XP_010555671.1 PREDICTED: uncharacterized protein LOC104825103 [Tarenaya hassleriana]XP_010555672.1 PREDICTED: uncharacterized protein LOC104825103 [Tarenaya hassleriana]XP_010555673.1 PREDICTED: uncharacterized protein LOC104825103 [Tarenaya hassleriana]
MPLAKSNPSNSMELVKQDGNDSLDMLIRRAVGRESFLTFPRPENNPVQLFQLLNAFDQPELPGWPLLTPLKVQMQKCQKCSREFCSPVNYRRHNRLHRCSRRPDKDYGRDRNILGAFWDKLSIDEAKGIASLKGMMLEEVSGPSVETALMTLIQKPGFTALPQYYLRAGSDLLDIIQARQSRFPISSQELFNILDDASEKTFLCGAAASMQKYIFDGETGKNALEAKNVAACTSFLLEQKLIEAWLADKDAESLRCQKLLVEEEEAAQRRQAELLERKRKKKLRQQEQRVKEQRTEQKEDAKESESTTSEEQEDPAEPSSPLSVVSDSEAQRPDAIPGEDSSSLEGSEALETNGGANCETQAMISSGACDDGLGNGHNMERRGGQRQMGPFRRLLPSKSQREMPNGFHSNPVSHIPKPGGMLKNGTNRDARVSAAANTTKVWSRKADNPRSISQDAAVTLSGQTRNSKVLIGSICVTLGNDGPCGGHDQTDCGEEDERTKNIQAKPPSKQSTVKIWRPVSRHGTKASKQVENTDKELEPNMILRRSNKGKSATPGEDKITKAHAAHHGSLQFNSREAKAFLAQRWKEATLAEHVTLVVSQQGC